MSVQLLHTFWSVGSTKLVYSVPSPHGKVCQCQYSVYTNYTNFQSREWFFTLTRHRLLQQQFSGRYQKPVEVTHESSITYKLKASEIPLKFAILHLHTFYCNEDSWSCLTVIQILTEWSEDVGMIHKMCAANQLAECHDSDDVVMKPGTEHQAAAARCSHNSLPQTQHCCYNNC